MPAEPTATNTFPKMDFHAIVAMTMHLKDGDCLNGTTTNVERREGATHLTLTWMVSEEHPTTHTRPIHRVRLHAKSWTCKQIGNVVHFIRKGPDDPKLIPEPERPHPDAVRYLLIMDPNGGRL